MAQAALPAPEEYETLHRGYINELKVDPIPMYKSFSERLERNGNNAEFPEFAPVVHKIKLELHSPKIDELCKSQQVFAILRNKADLQLASVSIALSWYPYASTIRAIYQAITFFDVVFRAEQQVGACMPYHAYRYLHYLDKLLDSTTTVIIFPTWLGLGATDMMRQFGTAIYIVGVNFEAQFVDEFLQSPSEFFIHDINHIRRFRDNSIIRYDAWKKANRMSSASETDLKLAYYTEQRECIKTLVPLFTPIKSDGESERHVKKMVKFILFEILHEEAEPALMNVVCSLIKRESAANYSTGFVDFVQDDKGKRELAPVVTPSASLLSFVRFKLWYGFYDEINAQNDQIAPLEARKIDVITSAAKKILQVCCNDNTDDAILTKLITDNQGLNAPVTDQGMSVFHDTEYEKTVNEINNHSQFTGVRPTVQEVSQTCEGVEVIWTTIHKADENALKAMIPLNPGYTPKSVVGGSRRRKATKLQGGGVITQEERSLNKIRGRQFFINDDDNLTGGGRKKTSKRVVRK